MNNELIERYIYAVTKRMSRKQREDVSLELKGLIEDMLAERCVDTVPSEKDIRVVLTELGTPQELYAKYDEDADKCLIGQPHYSVYKYVLKTMSIPFALGLAIAGVILQIMEPVGWFAFLENWIGTLAEGLFLGFAAVTLVFAVMHHKGMDVDKDFDLNDLSPVPVKKQCISRMETGCNIVLLAVLAVILLVVPQCFGIKHDTLGWITIFDLAAMAAGTLAIGLGFVAAITGEFVKLIEARYNKKVAYITLVTNLAQAVCGAWWLMGHSVMNPEFIAKLPEIFHDDSTVIQLFQNFQPFLLVVFILALVADTVAAFVRAKEE